MKEKITFIGAGIIAVFLVIFGVNLFSLRDESFTPGQFFAIGTVLLISGLATVSTEKIAHRWLIGFLMIGGGVYHYGRASDVIGQPWLAYLIGVACLAGAALLVYVTWPKKPADDLRSPAASEQTEQQ